MNIAEHMTEVLPVLRNGIDRIVFPGLQPECPDHWSPSYAIVDGLYYLVSAEYGDYFDHAKFRSNYEKFVESKFPGCVVKFYWKSQEIEVWC